MSVDVRRSDAIAAVVGANYTALPSDSVITYDCSGTARTLTLPTAASFARRTLTVKRIDAGSVILTIRGSGTEEIDGVIYGSFSSVVVRGMVSVSFLSNGTSWEIVSGREFLSRHIDLSWFGPDHTGVFDAATEIQAWIQAGFLNGARLTAVHGGTYRIDTAITFRSGITYDLPNVTFKAGSGMADDQSPLILCQTISNFTVIGLKVDGNNAGGTFTGEGKHGFRIRGCTDWAFEDVKVTDCPGDGINVADDSGLTHNLRGVFRNVDCYSNKRNGWSVNDAEQVKWYGCKGRSSSGTAPQAGLDFEPNFATAVLRDLDFFGCDFTDNGETGVLVSLYKTNPATSIQHAIRFHGGTIKGNLRDGVIFHRARDVAFNNVSVRSNGRAGYRFWTSAGTYSSSQDVAIRGGEIIKNNYDGIDARTDDTNRILGFAVDGVTIRDNGQSPQTTTLTAGIDASTTTVPVADTTWFGKGAEFKVDSEWFAVTAASTTSGAGNLTVSARGYDSSTAATHSNGATLTRSADGIAVGYIPGQDPLPTNKHEGIAIRNNSIGSKRGDTAAGQRYGITSTDDATDVTYLGNDLRNNVRGATKWADGGTRTDANNRKT